MNKLKNSFLTVTAALFILGGCSKNPEEKTFGIELSQKEAYLFPSVEAGSGYTATPLEVTVTNTGNQATGALQIALGGFSSGNFVLDKISIANVEAGKTATFTVAQKSALGEGDYKASVTVSGNANIVPQTFDVRFIVDREKTWRIELNRTGEHVFPSVAEGTNYTVESLTVTVTSTGNQATGDLTVALSGAGAGSFELNKTAIASINSGQNATFTVTPKLLLTQGEYTAKVTVSGGEKIEAQTFDVKQVVNEMPAYSYQMVSPPAKTVFGINEPLDLTGLVVQSRLGEGPWETYVINVANLTYDFSTPGVKTIALVVVEGVSLLEIEVTVKTLAQRIADAAGKTETIYVYANESIADGITVDQAGTNITLTTPTGSTTERVIKKTAAGSLFTVGRQQTSPVQAKLTVNGYITMKGLSTSVYGGTDNINNNTYLIAVSPGGTFEMKGYTKVTGNTNLKNQTAQNYGGGIGVVSSDATNAITTVHGGTLIIDENAEVSDNKTVNTGGVSGATNGYAYAGGVWVLNHGIVYLKGNAKITRNSAISNTRAFGGAFSQEYFSRLYMEGGEISENIADGGDQASSGALHLTNGSQRFYMTGGVIRDNVVKFGTVGRGSAITAAEPHTVTISGSASIIGKPDAFSETAPKHDSRNSIIFSATGRLCIKGTFTATGPIIVDLETGWTTWTNPLFMNVTGEFNDNYIVPKVNGGYPAQASFTDNAPIGKFALGRYLNITTGAYTMLGEGATAREFKPDGTIGLK